MRTAPQNEGRTFSVYVAREGTHQLSASANADRPSGYDSSHDRSPSDLGWRMRELAARGACHRAPLAVYDR